MNELYLIPNDGVKVRDPVTGLALPAKGASKPRTSYWLRRLRDGDVRVGEAPVAAASATAVTLSPQAQQLVAAEAALKTAEDALETATGAATQTAAKTTTSSKGAAK